MVVEAKPSLDGIQPGDMIDGMTMVELKQEVSRLSPRQRRELNAYMIRLRHQTPAWRKSISKRMREMDAGKKVTLEELRQRISRG